MQAAQNAIKMIASFDRGIYIPLIGANEQPLVVHNYLKEKGARVSLDHVKAMMEGRETAFKDFEVVQVTPATAGTQATAPAPKPVQAPRIPGRMLTGSSDTTPPLPSSGAMPVARGRGREYPASGVIKPLKRGTVYAKLMEMLIPGATMKELLSATTNTTAGGVNDVLSWQIKQRGYGLRFDQATGKFYLVFPAGQKALTYKD